MANIRDPAFWKRFSIAVHLDEESPKMQSSGIIVNESYVHLSLFSHLSCLTVANMFCSLNIETNGLFDSVLKDDVRGVSAGLW